MHLVVYLELRPGLVDLHDRLALAVPAVPVRGARPWALLLGRDVVAVLVAVHAELDEPGEDLCEVGEEQVLVLGVRVDPRAELFVLEERVVGRQHCVERSAESRRTRNGWDVLMRSSPPRAEAEEYWNGMPLRSPQFFGFQSFFLRST